MTGEYVTSVHSRIEKYTRRGTAESRDAATASDPAAYLRRIQTLRERTHRWDSDRMRSGARRIAGVNYQDTIPVPESIGVSTGRVALQLEMRRYRDAEIARRRQQAPQPHLGYIRGHRIVEQSPFNVNISASMSSHAREMLESAPMVDSPDLEILRRLLRTPSRVLAKSGNPLARLGSAAAASDSKSPVNGHIPTSTSSTPGARLPPVRGRLLPISMAQSLRSAHRQSLEDSLKTTRLPYVDDGPRWHRNGRHAARSQTSNSQTRPTGPDLHGFKIYQHLMGSETHRSNAQRHASGLVNTGITMETVAMQQPSGPIVPHGSNSPTNERHPILPLPSFPITQLLSKQPESSKAQNRVDYISINVAIPRADTSRPESPPAPRPPSRPNSEGTFVPPPSPANMMINELSEKQMGQWAELAEEDEDEEEEIQEGS